MSTQPRFYRYDIPGTPATAATKSKERWSFTRSPMENEHCATIGIEEVHRANRKGETVSYFVGTTSDCIFYRPSDIDVHIEDLKALKEFWIEKRTEREQQAQQEEAPPTAGD